MSAQLALLSWVTGALALALSGHSVAYDLEQHQWRARLLVLVAPSPDDPVMQRQLASALETRAPAMRDRDLLLLQLFRDSGWAADHALTAGEVAQLRNRLGIADSDRLMILIGLDGGVKRRAPLDIGLREIFIQIDEMPMRRDQIRAKRDAGLPVTEP